MHILSKSLSACSILALALAANAPAFAQEAGEPAAESEKNADDAGIIVTGTYIKSQRNQVSPTVSVDAESLQNQAAFNVDSLISNLPVNSGSQNNTDGGGLPFSIGTTNVNLRGLGISSTLTLLNGKRQVLSGAADPNGDQFVDLNQLVPTIAIQRSEVLKDGASSLYGSDAVAGVVNFITYKKFDGLRVSGDLGMTTREGQTDAGLGVMFGKTFGRGSIVLSGSYFDRTPLSAAKRRSEFPLRSSTSTFGMPGTFLVSGVQTPDPACAQRAAVDPNVVAPASGVGFCIFNFGDYFSLVAREKRVLTNMDAEYEFSDSLTLYAQGGWAKNSITTQTGPSQPVLTPALVPVTNPGNTFGRPVVFFGRPLGSGAPEEEVHNGSETWRFGVGARGKIGGNLDFDISYIHGENTYSLAEPDTLRDRFIAAINGVGGPNNNQFFNPRFGATNDPAVIRDFTGIYSFLATSKLDVVDAVISGSLAELPGGPLGFALGSQYRKQSLSFDYDANSNRNNFYFFIGNRDFKASQDAFAGFAEVSAPLIDTLTLTGALRYEDFGDGVNTLNPKIGALFQPAAWLSLRGTYGTSFRAPSVFQQSGGITGPARVFDPLANAQVTVSQRTTADPANPLEPQTSKTYNFGATVSGGGFTASIDYWNFAYENYISPENASALARANPNGPQLTRANGVLTNVTTYFRNAGKLKTDGLDFTLNYAIATALGEFTFDGTATRVLGYRLTDPVSGQIDGLGNRNYVNFGAPMPKLRGSAGLLWESDRFGANIYVRHIGSYLDDNNARRKIDAFTTVDAQVSISIPSLTGNDEDNRLAIGAKNLFDKMAPDALDRAGFDPLVANALGRIVYASVILNF